MVKEITVETYLRKRVEAMGGMAYKFVSPQNAGVPDRVVCMPGGKLFFVELKRPREEPRALQLAQIRRLRKLGQTVYVADSKEAVDAVLREATGG